MISVVAWEGHSRMDCWRPGDVVSGVGLGEWFHLCRGCNVGFAPLGVVISLSEEDHLSATVDPWHVVCLDAYRARTRIGEAVEWSDIA